MLQRKSCAVSARRQGLRRLILSAIAAAPMVGWMGLANAVDSTWTFNGDGNWTTAANWSNGEPNSATTDAFIDDGDSAVNVNIQSFINRTVGNLTIGSNDSVTIVDNGQVTIGSTSFVNAGTFSINSLGNFSALNIGGGGNVTLSGGGRIILNGTPNVTRLTGSANSLINVNNTIQGRGAVGANSIGIQNQAGGLIDANVGGNALVLDPSSIGFTNAGTLQASNGGILQLTDSTGAFTNTGYIQALNGSFIELISNSSASGGTFTTVGTGVIRTSGFNSATVSGITNTGAFSVVDNSSLGLSGSISNVGSITVNTLGNLADLRIHGDTSLTGGGTITFTGNTNTTGRLVIGTPGGILTNVNNTIVGRGQIGANTLAMINQGTIGANGAGVLTIDPANVANAFTNTGTITAVNGGVTVLAGDTTLTAGTFNNVGGTIEALDGSNLQLTSNATVDGGTFRTAGSGSISVPGFSQGYLSNATNNGFIFVNDNGGLHIAGAMVNNGSITLSATGGNFTDLRIDTATTLSGTGTIILTGGVNSRIADPIDIAGARLTNLGNTIQGRGQVGTNQVAITNGPAGVVNANVAGTPLTIDPVPTASDGSVSFINQGVLQASGGGILELTTGDYSNTGSIVAQTSSVVRLPGASITGGLLTTIGTGTLHIGNFQSGTLNSVTNTGSFVITDNGTLHLNGNLINNGSILASATGGNFTGLTIQVPSTLSGSGIFSLTSSDSAQIVAGSSVSGVRFTLSSTVEGRGNIGRNGLAVTVSSTGLINANTNGAILNIDPVPVATDAGAPFINQGTLRASGGGILALSGNAGGAFNNTGGTIEALAGSTVRLVNGVTVTGGTFTTSGTGTIVVPNANQGTISAATNSGAISVPDNGRLHLVGAINNIGSITVNAVGGNLTDIDVEDGATLNGGGTVTLTGGVNARIATVDALPGGRLTNNDNTLQGRGQIGANLAAITNKGLIDANTTSGPLTLDSVPTANDTGDTFINLGTMQSSGGGTLVFTGNAGGTFNNTGGTIQALTGSQAQLTNFASITGGTITTSGTGVVRVVNSNQAFLTSVTNAGSLVVNDNAKLHLTTGLNNTGSILVDAIGGNLTDLQLESDVTLTGSGTITLGQQNSRITWNGTTPFRLTNNGNTIEGRGLVGTDSVSFTNAGVVQATIAGQIMTVDPVNVADAFLNSSTGTVRAANGAIMNLSGNNGGAFTNNGIFESLNGSTLQTASGGVLTNNVAGVLTGGTYRSVATTTLNMLTFLAPNTAVTQIAAGTTVEYSGALASIRFGASTPLAASLSSNAGTLKIYDGHTFTMNNALTNSGSVELGGSGLANGTLNSGGPITNSNSGVIFGHGRLLDTVLNSGVVRASGGTLTVTGGIIDGQSGTITVDPGASLDLSGAAGASDTDFLNHNGANLNLGANNLLVRNDYTNANFGTGNSFNARANVTGTGQIQAQQAIVQAITGDVGAGDQPVATMDFGNIRVGSSTFGVYQVNNLTTPGPVLRGAIQTNNTAGNGGNITDARLSGTGVTAQNFGPIANNSASGVQTVTFNATSAGTLTGQRVAVVNNFDNVGDQTIAFSGTAYNPAVGTFTPGSINFGNFHVGDLASPQIVTIGNSAPAGTLTEDLLASNFVAAPDAILNNTGSFTVIGAGSNSTKTVGISTSTAGARTGTLTFNLASNATVNGVAIPGLGSLALGSGTVTVSANVYRLASANVGSVDLGEFHVGSIATGSIPVSNTQVNDAFSESLKASANGVTPDVIAAAGTATISPGASSGTAIAATISTATAGAKSGTVSIKLDSLAVAGTGLSNTGCVTHSAGDYCQNDIQ